METEDVVEVRREVSEEDGWGDVINVETDEVKEVEVVEEIEAALDDEGAGADVEASFEVLEVLETTGAGITTVTGGELTSMMEYFVAVVVATGLWETVTRIVFVVFGPSTIFVEIIIFVTAGNVTWSVSTTVTGA